MPQVSQLGRVIVPGLLICPVGFSQLPSGTYVITGATRVFPKPRAILSAVYSMTYLCSPSTICGPFCSVPAVGMMTVVVPDLVRSRTSAHVNSSMKMVSGGFAAGAVAGEFAGL